MATAIWNGSIDGNTQTAANWTPATIPVKTYNVIFPASASQAVTGLAKFPTDAADMEGFASVIIEDGVTYNIGTRALPLNLYMDNDDASNNITIGGTGTYFISPTEFGIITITSAGPAPADGQYAINLEPLVYTDTNAIIHVLCEENQSIGIAAEAGDTGLVASIIVEGGEVTVGSGATLVGAGAITTVTVNGGTVVTNSAIATAAQTGGIWTHMDGAISTAFTVNGGTCFYRSDGACPTPVVGINGVLDFSQDPSLRTFGAGTQTTIYPGATINDPAGTVTWTGGIDILLGGLDDVNLDIGENINIAKGATGQ